MKKTTKVVLGSAMTMAMCASLIAGSTLALFSSQSDVNIAVTSGKVNVEADAALESAYSAVWDSATNSYSSDEKTEDGGIYTFTTGGTATYADGLLTMSDIAPGDGVIMSISVNNYSTIATKYRVVLTGEGALAEALNVSLDGADLLPEVHDGGDVKFTDWTTLAAAEAGGTTLGKFTLQVELPVDAQDTYQEKSAELTVTVEALQGNADSAELYHSGNKYYVTDGEGLATTCAAVNSGENVDIILTDDVDLSEVQGDFWAPIGNNLHHFVGTFDGRGHKITGLTTNSLFRNIDPGATVENFTLDVHIVNNSQVAEATGLATFVYGSEDAVTTFRNVTLTGEVRGDNAYAGWCQTALSSYGRADGTEKGTEILFEDCVNELDVVVGTKNHAAAFVGNNYSVSTTFRNCVNKGDVSVSNPSGDGVHVGAFVGYGQRNGNGNQNIYRITFEGCINEGNVTTRAAGNNGKFHTGGFVGTMQNGSVSFIDCENKGAVNVTDAHASSGTCTAGGFLGCDNVSGLIMTNCKNSGNITVTVDNAANTGCAPQVGGLIGGSTGGGTVVMTDCTSIGTLTANTQGTTKYVGLLCGTKGGVTVKIMGSVWILQEDITSDTALVATATKIDAESNYEKKAYVG